MKAIKTTCSLTMIMVCLLAALLFMPPGINSNAASTSNVSDDPVSFDIRTPQKIYSVSTCAEPFKLNARIGDSIRSDADLTYSSSRPSVAKVSDEGIVKVGKKPGSAIITIRARGSASEESASEGAVSGNSENAVSHVAVRVTEPKPAKGMMIHSSIELDGLPGDSTGKESRIERYEYDNKRRSWTFLIRCNDPYVADLAATAATYIVGNPHFGFIPRLPDSQKNVDRRASIYRAVVDTTGIRPDPMKLKLIKYIDTYADTSCTPTILAGYWLYYDMNTRMAMNWIDEYADSTCEYYLGAVNVEAHQLEKAINRVNEEYADRGQLEPFSIIYVPKEKRASFFKPSNIHRNLKRGDILCYAPDPMSSGHTVMVQ